MSISPVLLGDTPARALAVYAHPDDVEVSCGGTLARWAAAGSEVHVVVATRGEKGSAAIDADPVALAEVRAAEVHAAAEVLGLAGVELLGHPDGDLDVDPRSLRAEIVAAVRRVAPVTVVCPDPTAALFGDRYVNHVDHRAIGWATLDAVAPAAASPAYFPEAGPPHQVETVLLSGSLEADVWVDVTATIDRKIEALSRHRSRLGEGDEGWLGDFVRSRAADDARRLGVAHAEGFRILRLG